MAVQEGESLNNSSVLNGVCGGSPNDITPEIIFQLDFSSRTCRPRDGQVEVVENSKVRFLAALVVEVLATSHGDLAGC
jgi:hypothetical protein